MPDQKPEEVVQEVKPIAKKGVASVKAPKEISNLVQINDQKPPVKKIAGPKNINLLQIDSDIVMDLGEKTNLKVTQNIVRAVDKAMTDKAEGAEDRALETSYIWTSLKPEDYRPKESKIGTVAQGMERTGGYVGTDMDQDDQNLQIIEELDAFAAQHLKILKKRRRQLREQILCADNCMFEKWSFMTGVSLSETCPTDCPVYELQGKLDHSSST